MSVIDLTGEDGIPRKRLIVGGHKSWVFTINNYTEQEFEAITLWDVTRMAVGKEKAPTTGTPHLQGFVTFRRPYRLSQLSKLAPRARWEVAVCDDPNYCLKTDSEELYSVDNRVQGKRRDIDKAYEAAKQKRSRREFILEEKPNWQTARVFDLALSVLHGPREIKPITVEWYFGGTGSGKTRAAVTENPGAYMVESFKWWDGYVGQDVVIIDDVRGDFCKFHEWLRLLDIYPLRKEVKGGWVECVFTKIIITAPISPEEMWSNRTHEDIAQLMRRITCVKKFENTPLGTLTTIIKGPGAVPAQVPAVTDTEVGKGNNDFPPSASGFSAFSEPLSPSGAMAYREWNADECARDCDYGEDREDSSAFYREYMPDD